MTLNKLIRITTYKGNSVVTYRMGMRNHENKNTLSKGLHPDDPSSPIYKKNKMFDNGTVKGFSDFGKCTGGRRTYLRETGYRGGCYL